MNIIIKRLGMRERSGDLPSLYQNIIEETPTGVFVCEEEGRSLLYANRKAREIFGIGGDGEWPDGEICRRMGRSQEAECEKCPIRPKEGGGEFSIGDRVYAASARTVQWDGRGVVICYLSDVTDERRASDRMRLANESLQRKYEEELLFREKAVSEDILATSRLNLTQRVVEEMRIGVKDGYEKEYWHLTDFSESVSLFTKKVWMTQEQKERLSVEGLLGSAGRGETELSEDFVAELRDGRHVFARAQCKILQSPEQGDVMAFFYVRDVTRERTLGLVVESIMSFEYDEIYTVDSANGTFTAMAIGQYALVEQKAEGRYEDELRCLIDRAVLRQDKKRIRRELGLDAVKRLLEKEQTHVLEATLVSRSGKPRRKQIRCMYLNREIGMYLMTVTDIEDVVEKEREKQDQLEKALYMAREASGAKSRFLASMSHEIRTPMNAIIGLNAMIQEDIDDKELVADCAKKLESASRYLLALLNDILDMSRIESGNSTLASEPFACESFWENVNVLARAQADIAQVEYGFEREGETEMYVGDSTRLEQILINLISNAIKFTPQGGHVRVKVSEEPMGNHVRVRASVSDDGIGISEEFLPHVFDTFAQQHQENTTAYKGSGLGLSIARSFAQMMDGDITVESTEGRGTTFRVNVLLGAESGQGAENAIGAGSAGAENGADGANAPERASGATASGGVARASGASGGEARASGASEGGANGAGASAPGGGASQNGASVPERDFSGYKVLLVEDHPLNTIVAKNLLSKRGFAIIHAENGAEALERFKGSAEGEFDLILMDIRMPVMDGIEATRRIRALDRADARSVPIVAMTANAYEEDRKQTREAGMNAHLAKPIDVRQFQAVLGDVLPEKGGRGEG